MHRAYKICSNESLISDEMRKIRKFMLWNGFPKTLANKLIQKFTPKADQAYMSSNINNHIKDQTDQVCKVYVRLPYIGKRGTNLMHKFKLKISQILKQLCKFIVYPILPQQAALFRVKIKHLRSFKVQWFINFHVLGAPKHT